MARARRGKGEEKEGRAREGGGGKEREGGREREGEEGREREGEKERGKIRDETTICPTNYHKWE